MKGLVAAIVAVSLLLSCAPTVTSVGPESAGGCNAKHPCPTPTPTPQPTPTPTPAPPTPTPAPTASASPTPPATGFLTRSGSSLTLNGQTFRFDGINEPAAVENPQAWNYNTQSARSFVDLKGAGAEVIRVFAFQKTTVYNGARNWTYMDAMLNAAESAGVKIIMTLTDEWTGQPASDSTLKRDLAWYQGGYKTAVDNRALTTYKAWVQEAATRYKNRTGIAFWQLVNEGSAEQQDGSCPNETTARDALRAFADDMAATIKAVDPNHLVSLGTVEGQCGSNGPDYQYIHSGANIDVADLHDYYGATATLGGDTYNGLKVNIDRIHAINKVVFTGESGIDWTQLAGGRDERANDFRAKMTAQYGAGTSGFLIWVWGGYAFSQWDYETPWGDPSIAVFGEF
jgi:mannan endo-1,4-beta-mannosidase